MRLAHALGSSARGEPGPDWSLTLPLAVAIALGLGIVGALWLFGRPLALFVLAVTLAAAVAPLASLLSRRLPHAVSTVLVYVALFAIVVLVGFSVVPANADEVSQLTQRFPEMVDRFRRAVSDVVPIGGDALARVVQQVVPRLVSASSQLAAGAVDVLVVVFLSMYLLIAAPAFRDYVRQLLPQRRRRHAMRLLEKMSREMGGYFRGAALNGAAVASLTWGALLVIGLDYAGPLAALAFFGELVPYLGPVVVAVPAIGVALLQSTGMAVTVTLTYIAIQQIEGHVLTPIIMHSQTHISPALVIIALTMGYSIGGIVGALAAIPVFAAARVIVRHVVVPEVRRRTRDGSSRARSVGGPIEPSPE